MSKFWSQSISPRILNFCSIVFAGYCLLLTAQAQAAGATPAVPSNVTGSIADGLVSITWDIPIDDDGVEGYNIYINDEYKHTVRTNSFSRQLEADTAYSFKIVAFDVAPRKFSPTSAPLMLAASAPPILPANQGSDTPSIPSKLTGSVTPGTTTDSVTLSWAPSTDDQAVAGYNIYRNRQYIATRTAPLYEGTVTAGSSNTFTVVAFDYDKHFSALSASLTLPENATTTNPAVPPSVPTNLAGETTTSDGNTVVNLTWTASTSTAKVEGYNIYRNNIYQISVFKPEYTDTIPAGQTYTYTVAAFDEFDNFSAKSESLSLSGDANQAPYFTGIADQTLHVGEPWELLLRPVDVDGGAAGVLISDPPTGMQFVDNQNGSRSLKWAPGASDVGQHAVTVTAFDLNDTSLRTSQTITLTVLDDSPVERPPFSISVAQTAYNLQEGSTNGVSIPITLSRDSGNQSLVSLSVEANNTSDEKGITTSFSKEVLGIGDANAMLSLKLAIDVLPIQSHQRQFTIRASDGTTTQSTSVTVAVTPVAQDDVYLLIGQSNMVGYSENNARQAGPGGLDEPHVRIKQANVEMNESKLFTNHSAYTSVDINFRTPAIITAQDSLHEPLGPDADLKGGTFIGMGMSFAKAALPNTSRNIILVPAAWSGSGFCNISSPNAYWNPETPSNTVLGQNTFLFDRAVARTNETLRLSGGILRGIIWHQGESDTRPECAPLYEENLKKMVAALRSKINVDARGATARGTQANVPFVAGTMSRGSDYRGDYSYTGPSRTLVENAHRGIASTIAHSEVALNDDLIPSNGYPCGEGSCIHFGAAALREMGARSYEALVRAAGN